MFRRKKENGCVYYTESSVLPSGQTVKIDFTEDEESKKIYYWIYLVTMNKRKSEDHSFMHTTGMDGIKGLLWAKQKICEFEEFIKNENKSKPVVVGCWWDDNRRRDVYERGLRNLGYRFTMLFGKKVLAKQITF